MKIAVVGTGSIIKDSLFAMKESKKWEVAAIFARPHSRQKGEELAKSFGIEKIFTDYDELVNATDFDFVYIAVANGVHYDYAKKALLADKNVILEKPFASTLKEAAELAAIAKEKNLYLFEAVTNLHLPNFAVIREHIGDIGAVRMVQANYSQYSSRYDKYLAGTVLPAFDPMLSGGALYDLNIYNINLIVALFGRPATVDYIPHIGFNGIDTSGVAILRYGGFTATAVGAKDSASRGFFMIQGEKGCITAHGAPNELPAVDVTTGGETIRHERNRHSHRMVHEFEEFARVYEEKNYNEMALYLTTSVQVMEAAESMRKSGGILFAADGR